MAKVNFSAHGFDWRRKRNRKERCASREAGKTKGKRCIATKVDRYMAKVSRSYKHRDYPAWCEGKGSRY